MLHVVDRISDSLSQGYTNLQSMVIFLDHRAIASDTVRTHARSCWAARCIKVACDVIRCLYLQTMGASCPSTPEGCLHAPNGQHLKAHAYANARHCLKLHELQQHVLLSVVVTLSPYSICRQHHIKLDLHTLTATCEMHSSKESEHRHAHVHDQVWCIVSIHSHTAIHGG